MAVAVLAPAAAALRRGVPGHPRLLRAVIRAEGMTGIVATHDPTIMELADRVIRLRDGTVGSDETAAATTGR